MIPPSGRYASVLAAIVLLFMLPVVWNRFEPPRVDDCADPDRLRDVAALDGVRSAVERWDKHDDGIVQWSQVELEAEGREVRLRGVIIRSYRPADLYTRPPSHLLRRFEAEQREVVEIRSGGETLPVQTLSDGTAGSNAMASYLFVYAGAPVTHPFWTALAHAPAQVLEGTRPLTLIMVAGELGRAQRPAVRRRAERFIEAAWRHYRAACLSPGSG